MRAIVIKESMVTDTTPSLLSRSVVREYSLDLDRTTPVTIVEYDVSSEDGDALALELSRLLKKERFYAHFVDDERMLVVFPRIVVEVRRDDPRDERIAQQVGSLFSVPDHQMRFLAMFDKDHPDMEPSQ